MFRRNTEIVRELRFKVIGVPVRVEMHLCRALRDRLHRQRRGTERIFVGCQFDNIGGNAEFASDLFNRLTALIRLNRVDAGFRF